MLVFFFFFGGNIICQLMVSEWLVLVVGFDHGTPPNNSPFHKRFLGLQTDIILVENESNWVVRSSFAV